MAEKGKLQSSTLFKQIGVDVDFVAQNANDSNNRLNDLYWNKTSGQRHGTGGQIENVKLPKNLSMIRNYNVDVNHAAVRSMAGGDASYAAAPSYGAPQQHQPQVQQHSAPQHQLQLDATVAAPGAPAQVAFDHSMITQLKAEIMQEMMNQIGGLASKMQQFADQTDRAISELQRQVSSASTQQTLNAKPRPAEDTSNNPAAAKLAEQNAIDPKSVSVSKMFNFSHSGGSGKRV